MDKPKPLRLDVKGIGLLTPEQWKAMATRLRDEARKAAQRAGERRRECENFSERIIEAALHQLGITPEVKVALSRIALDSLHYPSKYASPKTR
jgi:uncharacterized protein YfeS